jgi:DNA polymerase IV (archaeal DinB-like DNA polymerase)
MIHAHIDMDCFFSACEEKKNPELIGKPVIIGHKNSRGVVSTANYEARKYGVYSATPITKAIKLCPNGVFIKPDYKYYLEQSKLVFDIIKQIDPNLKQKSIDEAYFNITHFSKKFNKVDLMAKFIQNYILKKTKLSCSIGIAKSKIVAKIASDFKKPKGITIVRNTKEFLYPLAIEKIPGIGKKTKPYYNKNGVNTIGDLIDMNRFLILEKFGMYGVFLQNLALGKDVNRIHKTKSHSISRERTFEYDQSLHDKLPNYISELCELVHSKLIGYYYKTITIKIRYNDFKTITRSISVPLSTTSLYLFKQYAIKLFLDNKLDKPIRLLGVGLYNLVKYKLVQRKLNDYF